MFGKFQCVYRALEDFSIFQRLIIYSITMWSTNPKMVIPVPKKELAENRLLEKLKMGNYLLAFLLKVFTVLFLSSSFTKAGAQYLLKEDFEQGKSLWTDEVAKGKGHSKVIISPVGLDNTKALECFFDRADLRNESENKRSEVRLIDTLLTSYGQERWYALSMFIPEDYPLNAGKEIVFQFHGMPDKDMEEIWRSPPFQLNIEGGTWWNAQVRYDTVDVVTCNHCSKECNKCTLPVNDLFEFKHKVKRGSWSHWVFHMIWDPRRDGRGFLKAWLDRKQVISYQGPIGFHDKNSPYVKLGIYYYNGLDGKWPNDTPKRIIYDRFWVGDEKANLELMSYKPTKKP